MTTAIKTFLLLHGLLVFGQTLGASTATLESLLKTIAEGKGRPVYEAFKAVPEVANTPEKQAKAFEGLSIDLGQTTNYCGVPDYYPPLYHVRAKSFSYAWLASQAIRNLGEPGRHGLVRCLTSKPQPVATQAAIILCQIEASALATGGRPESKDFPPLDVDARKALESFLQQHGKSLQVLTLTYFYSAGLRAAAGHIHNILKATRDTAEKHSAALYLGSYAYEPALDDLLKIFKDTPDAMLRLSVRERLAYFADSDRVTKAVKEIMENAKDEGLRKDCQVALELVSLKAEWVRQYGTRMTNDSPHVPKTGPSLDKQ